MSADAGLPTFDDGAARPRELASLLCSGLSGPKLTQALFEHFADLPRFDVYLGVATAVSLLLSDLAVADAEILIVREELARLRGGKA